MELYASEKPSVFGQKLGRELFGEGKVCELISLIIGKTAPERIPEVRVTRTGTNCSKVSSV